MKQQKLGVLAGLALLLVVAGVATAVISATNAATPGLRAAESPRHALGVSGTSASTFARWLDRDDVANDIKWGESNGHFNPSSITSKIKAAGESSNRSIVVTISATPENNTNFMPDRSKPASLCGTYGDTTDATETDYQNKSNTFKLNGVNIQLARANIKAAKHDQNQNNINDNIEHLWRAYSGCYDTTYDLIADAIIQHKAYEYHEDGRPKMVIRFGHEHDGDFYEWSSTNQTDNISALNALTGGLNGNELYKRLWQKVVSRVNERVDDAVPGAKVHWEFNMRYIGALGGSRALLDATYPGDQYVDVFGIDFYDRRYGSSVAECFRVIEGEQQVPDCRTDAEKTSAWDQTKLMIDTISDYANERGKPIGVSEVAISTAVETKDGQDYWAQGGDNVYWVERSYEWVRRQTEDLDRLAYYVVFERNGQQASKELGSVLGADGLKSIHKMAPGATNQYQIPAGNSDATCVLQWDFVPRDENNVDIPGAAPQTHLSRFPKAANKFLELWAGPLEGGPATHPNCPEGSGSGPTNTPPLVSIGSDLATEVGQAVQLNASVSDDGQPNPPGQITLTWSKVSGPGEVSFSNPGAANTSVTIDEAGDHVLQLSVTDGQATRTDRLTVTVRDVGTGPPSGQITLLNVAGSHQNGTSGFPRYAYDSNLPSNWSDPVNFANGESYVRFEITGIEANHGYNLNAVICMYGSGSNEQICSAAIPFSGEEVTWATLGSPDDWNKRNNQWNFSIPPGEIRIQFRDSDSGKNLLTSSCGTTCTTDDVINAILPIDFKVDLVLTSEGSPINPLAGWTGCPIEFRCFTGGSPVGSEGERGIRVGPGLFSDDNASEQEFIEF